VNYFDVAPAYGRNGECEISSASRSSSWIGRRLPRVQDAGSRQRRREEGARNVVAEVENRPFRLYQMHTWSRQTRSGAPWGRARRRNLPRGAEGREGNGWVFAHSTRAAVEALKAFPFDTVMSPISFADYYLRDFGREVIEAAGKRGAAVVPSSVEHGSVAARSGAQRASGGTGRPRPRTKFLWRCGFPFR